MGAYLSSPVTEKISCDKSCKRFIYGASSMQGWRISQEDAHNCLPEFDQDGNTAMFAVYDGHGGAEVAQYCSKFLPACIKDSDQYKEGLLKESLVDAFLKFDSTLVQEDVIKELKLLAGVDEHYDEDGEEDHVARAEADDLKAEADLPLDVLLAKYQTPGGGAAARNLRKKENYQSPVVRPKKNATDADEGSSCSKDTENGSGSSNSNVAFGSRFPLTNGLADNENNLNKERELQDSAQAESSESKDGGDACGSSSDQSGVNKISSSSQPSCAGEGGSSDAGSSAMHTADSSTGSLDDGSSAGCTSVSSDSCDMESSSSCISRSSKSTDPCTDGVSSSSSVVEEGSSASGSGSSSKAGGSTSGSNQGAKNGSHPGEEDMDDDDSDDDDDEDDEDEWQDIESGEEEEDGMEDEEEEPMMDLSNEEPGSDSGCTACVVLLKEDQLVVANAGDSRCVLCRGTEAVDMSHDHKPEDDEERRRIEKAGGKVTADGRVNGGLNLSRAIGDHFYKRKEDLPAEQQMITALPDTTTITLIPEDQFFIVACDGIWNSLSSQECVDFVAERLKDPVKKSKPSIICEELFDHCLADNTYGDGTGCDNMTCIIVVLDSSVSTGQLPSKRTIDLLPSVELNEQKRPRVSEEEEEEEVKSEEAGKASQ